MPRPGGHGLWTAMGNRRYRPQALVTRALPHLVLESTVMWARIGGLPAKVRRACERPRGWGRVRPRAVSGGGRRRRRDGCATAARRAEGCAATTIHEGVPDREPEAHVLSSDACGAGEWAAGRGAQSNRGQTAEGWVGLQGRDEQGEG